MRRGSLSAGTAVLGIACLATLLASCRKKAAPGAPPPPQVTVLTVQPRTIPGQFEWVAEAAASKSVQVRSQVSGVIVARPYVEGTDVPKGKVLYRIDPRTYQANYESAKARLAESEAQFANAERTLNRLNPLLGERAVAQQDVDNAQATYDQYHAAVLDAQAAVDAAKKNYDDGPSSRATATSGRCSPPSGRLRTRWLAFALFAIRSPRSRPRWTRCAGRSDWPKCGTRRVPRVTSISSTHSGASSAPSSPSPRCRVSRPRPR